MSDRFDEDGYTSGGETSGAIAKTRGPKRGGHRVIQSRVVMTKDSHFGNCRPDTLLSQNFDCETSIHL